MITGKQYQEITALPNLEYQQLMSALDTWQKNHGLSQVTIDKT
jgi:hypothetical protein